jgi:hypothetical protein
MRFRGGTLTIVDALLTSALAQIGLCLGAWVGYAGVI